MLIQFTVGNYKSFKDPVTFSMVAAKNMELPENTFKAKDNIELLKSAIIYGANAGGKSNLIKAMSLLRSLVLKEDNAKEIPATPFKLNSETEKKPSFFELVFIQKGILYRYGFEADRQKVHKEWLYRKEERETPLFKREGDEIELFSPAFKKEAEILKEKTYSHTLFLSVMVQFKGKVSTEIMNWFNKFTTIREFPLMQNILLGDTIKKVREQNYKPHIMELLKHADVGVLDFDIEEKNLMENEFTKFLNKTLIKELIAENAKDYAIETLHQQFKGAKKGRRVKFNFNEESDGTQKLIALAGPFIEVLQKGEILAIDEFDARLHPLIARELIKLFNSPQTNPHNAQLIIVAHDTTLIDNSFMNPLFRRDQIWFTEKDRFGASQLYSLADFGKVRNNDLFRKAYLKGIYGAIPFIRAGGLGSDFEEEK